MTRKRTRLFFRPLLIVIMLNACSGGNDTKSNSDTMIFRCIDQTWFELELSYRANEATIWEPGQRQVRVQKAPSEPGTWLYTAGGYTLRGRNGEAVLVRENRLPIRCTAASNAPLAQVSWADIG